MFPGQTLLVFYSAFLFFLPDSTLVASRQQCAQLPEARGFSSFYCPLNSSLATAPDAWLQLRVCYLIETILHTAISKTAVTVPSRYFCCSVGHISSCRLTWETISYSVVSSGECIIRSTHPLLLPTLSKKKKKSWQFTRDFMSPLQGL